MPGDSSAPALAQGPPAAPRLPRVHLGRRHLALALAALVAVWTLLVFAGAAADGGRTGARAAELRDQNAALRAQLEAGRAEVQLIQSDAFARLQARAYGLGEPGERPFSLAAGAPPGPTLVPLGGPAERTVRSTPLEDWLNLLLGP